MDLVSREHAAEIMFKKKKMGGWGEGNYRNSFDAVPGSEIKLANTVRNLGVPLSVSLF